jgi:hypothetical protein
MNKIKKYTKFLIIICVVIIAASCEAVKSNSNVEDVINHYWASSLNAEAEGVMEMTDLPPKDFLQDCIGEVKKNGDDSVEIDPIRNNAFDKTLIAKEKENCNKSESCRKVNDFIDNLKKFDNEIPDYVQFFSSYIFVNKQNNGKPKGITIERTQIYRGEALGFVKIPNYQGEYDESNENNLVFFLKKKDDGWRIISISDKKTSDDKYDYARPRPKCNESNR